MRHQDFADLLPEEWDHFDVPFDRAKEMLDGLLDWRTLKPWHYRKSLGYLLRSQDSYQDVLFQLGRFRSKHADWKPFLAHILGFDSKLLIKHYELEDQLSKVQTTEKTIKGELGGSVEDISKIEGMLLLKEKAADKKQRLLDAFDFRPEDSDQTKRLVDEIDEQIAALNTERYYLSKNLKKIIVSLEGHTIQFNPEEAELLFREAGVLFAGQLKKDFDQLIAFNKAITEERRLYGAAQN